MPLVNGNLGVVPRKWEGRIIIEIEASTRKEAKAALKAMFDAYGFVEVPTGVTSKRLGNVVERKP